MSFYNITRELWCFKCLENTDHVLKKELLSQEREQGSKSWQEFYVCTLCKARTIIRKNGGRRI